MKKANIKDLMKKREDKAIPSLGICIRLGMKEESSKVKGERSKDKDTGLKVKWLQIKKVLYIS